MLGCLCTSLTKGDNTCKVAVCIRSVTADDEFVFFCQECTVNQRSGQAGPFWSKSAEGLLNSSALLFIHKQAKL